MYLYIYTYIDRCHTYRHIYFRYISSMHLKTYTHRYIQQIYCEFSRCPVGCFLHLVHRILADVWRRFRLDEYQMNPSKFMNPSGV